MGNQREDEGDNGRTTSKDGAEDIWSNTRSQRLELIEHMSIVP